MYFKRVNQCVIYKIMFDQFIYNLYINLYHHLYKKLNKKIILR